MRAFALLAQGAQRDSQRRVESVGKQVKITGHSQANERTHFVVLMIIKPGLRNAYAPSISTIYL